MTKSYIQNFRKKDFQRKKILEVLLEQTWLAPKMQELECLFDHEDKERCIFLAELLKRFCFLDDNKIDAAINYVIHEITEIRGFKREDTLLVASSVDGAADSGQSTLQILKAKFAAHGWTSVKTSNQIGKAGKISEKYGNVIIVDEFAGTGTSIVKRVNHFLETRKSAKVKNPINLCVILLAVMRGAKDFIEQNGFDLTSPFVLCHGIDDFYDEAGVHHYRDLMSAIEDELDQSVSHRDFPRFGFGGAQSLYWSRIGNAPNSNFPIFWWPAHQRINDWKPLLPRSDEYFFGND